MGCGGGHHFVLYYIYTGIVFQWVVGQISWIMSVLEEQDGAVAGVPWPLPFGPASDIKCTLLALAVTPLQRTQSDWVSFTRWIFHVVYKVIISAKQDWNYFFLAP